MSKKTGVGTSHYEHNSCMIQTKDLCRQPQARGLEESLVIYVGHKYCLVLDTQSQTRGTLEKSSFLHSLAHPNLTQDLAAYRGVVRMFELAGL